MKKWLRSILLIIGIAVISGGIIAYRIFTKPHRDVSNERGLRLTAQNLYDAFRSNETDANAKYLDKAIELSGEILDVSTNQDGKTVVNCKTDAPLFVINCTFKIQPGKLIPGQHIVFKGICTGYIPDVNVVINEGVQIK